MTKKILFINILFIISVGTYSQQVPENNQYLLNKSLIVPAFSGQNENIESFLTFRQKWVGIKGSPMSGFFNISGAFNKSMGFGLTVISEKVGNFSQNYLSFSYSYHLYVSENLSFSAGISPMFYRNSLNLSSIKSFGLQVDPLLLGDNTLTLNAYDVGISLSVSFNDFNFGISVPQTMGLTSKYNELIGFSLKRHFFGFLSYYQQLSNWGIEPMIVVRTTENSPVNYSGSIRVNYKNRLWVSAGYAASESIPVAVGILSNRNLMISYCYEIGIGGLSKITSGTHEVSIGFLIKSAEYFNKKATVFLPPLSSKEEPEDKNLTNKVATLEAQIEYNKQHQADAGTNLQRQLDSLKNKKSNDTTLSDSETSTTQWKQKIVSLNITFGLINDKLFSSSYSELEKYAQKLANNSKLRIKILVYTDDLFSEEVNQQLSVDRAKAIADYFLLNSKISKSQIEYLGMGADRDKNEATSEKTKNNSRVEFMLSEKIF